MAVKTTGTVYVATVSNDLAVARPALTLSAWLMKDPTSAAVQSAGSGSNPCFWNKGANVNIFSTTNSVVSTGTPDQVSIGVADSAGVSAHYNLVMVAGVPYHVAIVFDGSAGTAAIYINSVSVPVINGSGLAATTFGSNAIFEFGYTNANKAGSAVMILSQLGLKYAALLASDIAAIFNATVPGNEGSNSPLITTYGFDWFPPLNGTPGATVSVADTAVKNIGSLGFGTGNKYNYTTKTGAGTMVYAADIYNTLIAQAVTVSAIQDTNLTLTTTTAVGGVSPYTYQFQQAPDVSGSPGAFANIGPNSSALTLNVAGLSIGQTYWFRVIATDSAGTPATSTSAAVSATTAVPQVSVGTAVVTKNGLVLISLVDVNGNDAAITAIDSNPTLKVNGTSVPYALAIYHTIVAGGSAYTSGDTISASDGTHTIAGILTVATVNLVVGVITAVKWRGVWQTNWGTPTISITTSTGSGATVTVVTSPVWTSTSKALPFMLLGPIDPIVVGDTVTYSGPSHWASIVFPVSGGSTRQLYSVVDAPVLNYLGMLEPQFTIAQYNMKLGLNFDIYQTEPYNPHYMGKNARFRSQTWSVAGGTFTPAMDGSLVSWTSTKTALCSMYSLTNTNNIDSSLMPEPLGPTIVVGGPGTGAIIIPNIVNGQITSYTVNTPGTGYTTAPTITVLWGYGRGATAHATVSAGGVSAVVPDTVGQDYCDGLFRLGYDDSAPGVSTATTWELGISSTKGTMVKISDNSGSVVGGIGYRKVYYGSYVAAPSSWSASIFHSVTNAATSGLATNGVPTSSLTVTFPNNSDTYTDAWALNDVVAKNLTTVNGKTPAAIRTMGSTIGSGGRSNQVVWDDAPSPTAWRWGDFPALTGSDLTAHPTQSRSMLAGVIRPYLIANSPNVYLMYPTTNTVTSDDLTISPYMIPLASMTNGIGFMRPFSPSINAWIPGEIITTDSGGTPVNHNLCSGQMVTFGIDGNLNVACTNGSKANVSIHYSQGQNLLVMVTGKTKFVVLQSVTLPNGVTVGDPTGLFEGNVNQLAGTTTLGTPSPFTITNPDTGNISCNMSVSACNRLGSAYWCNVPHAANDDFVTQYATAIISRLSPACELKVEHANEAWNQGPSYFFFTVLGSAANPPQGRQATYAARAARVWELFESVKTSLGWAGTITRVLGGQKGDSSNITSAISYLAGSSGVGKRVDQFAMDGYYDAPTDAPHTLMAASFCDANALSITNGQPGFKFSRKQYIDMLRWKILKDTLLNAQYAANIAAVAANYTLGTPPKPVSYECSLQTLVRGGIATSGTALVAAAAQDVFFDPDAATLVTAMYAAMNKAGFVEANQFQYCQFPGSTGSATWCLLFTEMQPYGDGSSNTFGVQPGGLTSNVMGNVSPVLNQFRALMDLANGTASTSPSNYAEGAGVIGQTSVNYAF